MEESDIILGLLKKGEKKGLEMLFRKFYEPLVLYAYKYLEDQAEAEDTVQDVFIKFWKRNQFTDIQSYLRSYLYQSVRNNCLNRLKARKEVTYKGLELVRDFTIEEVPEEGWLTDRLENMYREIEKLPLRTRQIFKAVVLENKKYKEVAETEHISVNTVKTLLSRALSTLRNNLNGSALIVFCYFFKEKINCE